MDTYHINIAGVERDLIKYPVNDKIDIAAFILFGLFMIVNYFV